MMTQVATTYHDFQSEGCLYSSVIFFTLIEECTEVFQLALMTGGHFIWQVRVDSAR